uniref:Uncharacterized protein n=1 Tax=Candidatus Kentrum sp. FM TaxID=2126340 RepID=A0A450S7I7_9GAMM|nr:MAG: hypothetical protein BECKFM1743A_GA0114220_1004715 [Candidatus Kentron sp. FM]VFJ47837.1 MAG: hypothetical protein BECKFM1743C_GA0114222_100516 [Candidatus Kentron sp. FM]VFK07864.1 MAG: hypothetical protein BECKFM1743B_GA0114221_1005214 [Candidatus Kentron sp. FM]
MKYPKVFIIGLTPEAFYREITNKKGNPYLRIRMDTGIRSGDSLLLAEGMSNEKVPWEEQFTGPTALARVSGIKKEEDTDIGKIGLTDVDVYEKEPGFESLFQEKISAWLVQEGMCKNNDKGMEVARELTENAVDTGFPMEVTKRSDPHG